MTHGGFVKSCSCIDDYLQPENVSFYDAISIAEVTKRQLDMASNGRGIGKSSRGLFDSITPAIVWKN